MFNQFESYQFESYSSQGLSCSGIKSFWTVLNNKSIFDIIKYLIGSNKATSITSFDFLILYTNIPHGKLIRVLKDHRDSWFKGRNEELIIANRYGAQWSNREAL